MSTDTSPLCNTRSTASGDYCVVIGSSVSLAAGVSIRVYGSRPLLLVSTGAAELLGNIDVSSNRMLPQPRGAGANPTAAGACTSPSAALDNSGGAGGSFGGQGGAGEVVGGSGNQTSPAAAQSAFPTTLHGGCPGGDGSTDAAGMLGGAGGYAGGAIAIIATSLHLDGKINASGDGGAGGPAFKSGAGGGGSGGMIVIDAAATAITAMPGAWLFANGGGGGQGGADGQIPAGGGPGSAGTVSTGPAAAGAGGSEPTQAGGIGGNGSVGPFNKDGFDAIGRAQDNGGGGGGGGGGGFIHAPGVTATAVAPPSMNPS